jgi:hypothetical protein
MKLGLAWGCSVSMMVMLGVACGGGPTPAPKSTVAQGAVDAGSTTTNAGAAAPLTRDRIDALLDDEWKKRGVTPSAPADDVTFLRRLYLDVVGTIPEPAEVTAFKADQSPDKRTKKIAELLASPAYANHFMNYWDDVLMGRDPRTNVVDRNAFRTWLGKSFRQNKRWDVLVRELVSATGQNSHGGPRSRALSAMPMLEPAQDAETELAGLNGAVNYMLRFQDAPQDLAGTSSRVFLGVQIQCAQCHDHKTETWKQEDFRSFASAFLHLRPRPLDDGKMNGEIRKLEVTDFRAVFPRLEKNPDTAPIARAKAKALDGTDLEKGEGTRRALADWMVSPQNPWFAKAIVNRMWGHFMGRGFVDPVDDLRPSNPAVAEPLLNAMALDFAQRGYDLKALITQITSSRAYALSAQSTPGASSADPDNHLWGHFHLVPLGPEELLSSLVRATNVDEAARRAGVQNMPELRAQMAKSFGFLFDVDEEADAPDYEGTVAQALTLLNGNLTGYGSRAIPGSALTSVLATKTSDGDVVDDLYLRVLSRPPTAEERAAAVEYVHHATTGGAGTAGQAAPLPSGRAKPKKENKRPDPLNRLGNKNRSTQDPRTAAFEDVMWALLNSSEFSFNH